MGFVREERLNININIFTNLKNLFALDVLFPWYKLIEKTRNPKYI